MGKEIQSADDFLRDGAEMLAIIGAACLGVAKLLSDEGIRRRFAAILDDVAELVDRPSGRRRLVIDVEPKADKPKDETPKDEPPSVT